MKYWLDLFTGTTWDEFRNSGARVSGFSNRMRKTVAKIQQGDVLLCYLTGVMRWVGALEIIGPSTDKTRIWKNADFPARVAVKPLVMLSPENGIPMVEFEGKVGFYLTPSDRGKFKGFVRMSPNLFRSQADGDLILKLMKQAEQAPVPRPVDAKKLARNPFFKAERRKGKDTVSTVVTVPVTTQPSGSTGGPSSGGSNNSGNTLNPTGGPQPITIIINNPGGGTSTPMTKLPKKVKKIVKKIVKVKHAKKVVRVAKKVVAH